ncbi:MAG TPA: hypothetical protein VFJ82_00290 [Longimicrobium sp.]|nr:hypothetical protein [Longimicrobium sp.]
MHKLAAVLLVPLAACAPAAAGAGSTAASSSAAVAAAVSPPTPGTYLLRQMNGRDLPAPSAMEPNVELSRGVMQLNADHTFSITLTGRRNQEPTPGDEHMSGNYTVAGDVLTFGEPGGEHSPSFHFTQSGASLTLRDDRGNTYLFDRQ